MSSAGPAVSPLRVILDTVPWFAYPGAGGATTKLNKLHEYLRLAGHEVEFFDKWSPKARGGDVYHYFSSVPAGINDIRFAKAQDLAVVIEPIYWVTLRYLVELPCLPVTRRVRGIVHLGLKAAAPGLLRQTRMLRLADLLLPNSATEADLLRRHFGVPARNIYVAHNAADRSFLHADPSLFTEQFGLRDFVLSVGNIEPRKNQARLARAARQLGVPLVLIGNVLPHQSAYGAQVRAELAEGSLLLEDIQHEDALLRSAYAAARVFALPSFAETPGKAALEAALAGTPVVVTKRGSASDYFGDLAEYVEPNRLKSIQKGIERAYVDRLGLGGAACSHVATKFTWETAAEERVDAYRTVLRRRSGGR